MTATQASLSSLPPHWTEFLTELDKLLTRPVELHCIGRFVLTAVYGMPLPTGDVDYIVAVPNEGAQVIQAIAGQGSSLAKKYRIYVDHVTVADYPDGYESRMNEIFPGQFSKLRLLALDPNDIVLSKLTRNHPVDDADVQFLVRKGILDPSVLRARYERELRPYLENQERHDTTLKLWLEYF